MPRDAQSAAMVLERFYQIVDAGPYAMGTPRSGDVVGAVQKFLMSMRASKEAFDFVSNNEARFFSYRQLGMHLIELAELSIAATQQTELTIQ